MLSVEHTCVDHTNIHERNVKVALMTCIDDSRFCGAGVPELYVKKFASNILPDIMPANTAVDLREYPGLSKEKMH